MKLIAEKIADATGCDPESIDDIISILEEGFCTLSEVANENDHLVGVKLTVPLTSDPKLMVYSALASCVVVMRDVYKKADQIQDVVAGIRMWQKKACSPITALSDEELMTAFSDPKFSGLYAKEIMYYKNSKQGGVNPDWVKKSLVEVAFQRGLIAKENFEILMEELEA